MVKKVALIGSIIMTIGLILTIVFVSGFWAEADQDYTFDMLLEAASPSGTYGFTIVALIFILLYLGMIIIYVGAITTKNKMLIVGGILGIVGAAGVMLNWIMMDKYNQLYMIMHYVYIGAMIVYVVGLITYKRNYKIGLGLGPILLVMVIISDLVFGVLQIQEGYFDQYPFETMEPLVNRNLQFQMFTWIVFLINGWAFSFSKNAPSDDDDEDEISIEKDNAFASYVPDNMKSKKKKSKDKGGSDEIVFEF